MGLREKGLPKRHLRPYQTSAKDQAEERGTRGRACTRAHARVGAGCRGYCRECFDFFDHGIMAPRQISCYSAVIHLVKKDRKQQSELNSPLSTKTMQTMVKTQGSNGKEGKKKSTNSEEGKRGKKILGFTLRSQEEQEQIAAQSGECIKSLCANKRAMRNKTGGMHRNNRKS